MNTDQAKKVLARQTTEPREKDALQATFAAPRKPTKRLQINFTEDQHTAMKVLAAQRHTTITGLVIEALKEAYDI